MKKRILLIITAILLLALISCADANTADTDDVSSDTETDIETNETTDTEPIDTEDTEPIETPDPVTISGVTYEYRDGGYVATGMTSTNADRATLVDKIEEIPVIGIADGAFDSVDDPLNFRIFGYEDTFAREYAVENGHIFIEYFEGKFPNHYYPEGIKLYDWVETEPHDIPLAIDDNAEIDALVADYLNGKDTYNEILERVLYRMICYDRFLRWFDSDWAYYSTEGWYTVGDYDRYVVYLPPEEGTDWTREFEMGRFGRIESYSELTKNVALLSQNEFWLGEILNVEDHIFMPYVGSGSPSTSDESCHIEITEDVITLYVEYFVDETKHQEGSIEFQRTPEGWYFSKIEGDVDFVVSVYLYEIYCGEIRNKYTGPSPDPVTISGVTYEYRAGGYVATGVTSTNADRATLVDKIEDIPVTGIEDGAFDSVDDPLNFRIFGYEDSFARDYAVKHGHIFIEYFNGKLPNHYYPYSGYPYKGDESVWIKNPDADENFYGDIFYVRDDDEIISDLVTQYLNDGTGYNELLERVMYRIVCASEIYYEFADVLPDFYIREYESETVDDYDKYAIYFADDPYYPHYMVRYGKLETYDEFFTEIEKLFTPYGQNFFEKNLTSVDGYMFQAPMGGPGGQEYGNAEYEMVVYQSAIILTAYHRNVTFEEDEYDTYELILKDGKWVFEHTFYAPWAREDYLDYIASY